MRIRTSSKISSRFLITFLLFSKKTGTNDEKSIFKNIKMTGSKELVFFYFYEELNEECGLARMNQKKGIKDSECSWINKKQSNGTA